MGVCVCVGGDSRRSFFSREGAKSASVVMASIRSTVGFCLEKNTFGAKKKLSEIVARSCLMFPNYLRRNDACFNSYREEIYYCLLV